MAVCCAAVHTITLSNDGTLHSFGNNREGQLGLGHNKDVSLPTPIPNLPQINMISCGGNFTVCVDHEGFIWTFGENNWGQLGTGNTRNFKVPQKILNIPPVVSISCGSEHTLIITNDSNLWSCGKNQYGQLCHGHEEGRLMPQQTSFSNISNISAGSYHSLFQNNKGEIFGCGYNQYGQCGLGHFNHPQIKPSLIPNVPSNIVQFACGDHQSLFLDLDGNVFSVGDNYFGELGLGPNRDQNKLNKIPNIPPIKVISCVSASCYLIDFEGNLWTFGDNEFGQLGHGDTTHIYTPKIINTLKDIQQISYGSCGDHFLAKGFQNQIFVTGKNNYGLLLSTRYTQSISIPKEINPQYFPIWGSNQHITNEWEVSEITTTIMKWQEEEMKKIEILQSKIKQVKLNLSLNNNKFKQEFPQNSFESWNEVHDFLNEKSKQIHSKLNEKQNIELQNEKDIQTYEMELKDIEHQLQQLQSRKKEIEENFLPKAKQSQRSFEESFKQIKNNQKLLQVMCFDVSTFCKNENEMNQELCTLFKQKKFEEFDCFEISKCLWKMDLTKYQSIFEQNQINGLAAYITDDDRLWKQLGVEKRDCFYILFHFEMMKTPGYFKIFSPDYDHDCCVCSHNTPEKTIHLLKEYEIPIEDNFILKNNYCSSILTSKIFLKNLLGKDYFSKNGIQTVLKLNEWKKIHKDHLKSLRNQ